MRPEYATVVDVIQGKGVKIKKDGEKEALDIYYNNLGAVNVGDKVYIKYTSGSILVVGKVHSGNTDTGGGSSTGVTKEYVDTKDAELSRQINVLSTGVSNIENTRKLKTYLGLQDIGMTTESTFLEIAQAMPNNSTILFSSYAPLNWFPQSVTGDRNDIEITRYGGGISYIKVWLSNVKTGVWHGYYTEQTGLVWQQLATTTKTDILCTPSSGYKITSQGSCVINNIVYLSITIEKSDGGIIPQNALVAIVPSAYKPTNGLKSADSVTLAGTSVNGVASCLVSTTGNIQYTGTATNTTKLLINTQYVI